MTSSCGNDDPLAPDGEFSSGDYDWGHPLAEEIYLSLRAITDPEKPYTLEELEVVYPEGIVVICEDKTRRLTVKKTIAASAASACCGGGSCNSTDDIATATSKAGDENSPAEVPEDAAHVVPAPGTTTVGGSTGSTSSTFTSPKSILSPKSSTSGDTFEETARSMNRLLASAGGEGPWTDEKKDESGEVIPSNATATPAHHPQLLHQQGASSCGCASEVGQNNDQQKDQDEPASATLEPASTSLPPNLIPIPCSSSSPGVPRFVEITFKPTSPVCSLATLIGLAIMHKMKVEIPTDCGYPKFQIKILEGSHQQGDAVTKQLNDKERRYAAMENPDIARAIREACKMEGDYDE